MKILITSGGTDVPIDSVRKITNMSTGRFGTEIAEEFDKLNHYVTFVHSKGSIIPPKIGRFDDPHINITHGHLVEYKDYNDYLNVIEFIKEEHPDIIISAAAVSDYIVANPINGKLSSSEDELVIRLKKAKKVLPEFKKVSPKSMVVGFKLLVSPTYQEVHKAVQKVLNNGADYVVYNDLTEIRKGNSSRLVFSKNMNFREVKDAKELVDYIINEYTNSENSNGV